MRQEMVGQRNDVGFPGAQGRDGDLQLIDAVKKVGAEAVLLDLIFQVLVGGGQHPDIDLDRVLAFQRGHLAVFQDPQQLGLDVGMGSSPISSRRIVPWSARTNFPGESA